MSSYSTMTDKPLVEAVALAISGQDAAGWQALPEDDRQRLYGGGKWQDSGHTRDDYRQDATAALRAIEDAGYKIIIDSADEPAKPTP